MDLNNLDGAGAILNEFVSSVTYAMKTSIAGILYSLLMTVLNTIAPVKGLRDRTDKKFSNCLENIWMAIHEKGNEEEQSLELLKQMNEHLIDLKTVDQINHSKTKKSKTA